MRQWIISDDYSCTKIYRATIGSENALVNAKDYIDNIYLEGALVLRMVDDATDFSADQFVDFLGAESAWETIL